MKKTVKLLIYCTKAKPYLLGSFGRESIEEYKDYWTFFTSDTLKCCYDKIINGKIVAEADCELVEEICCDMLDNGIGTDIYYYIDNDTDIEELACLDINDLATYLPQKRGGEKVGYAIYLKNVMPFDEPKELSYYGIKKAPQNMCYLYDKDGKIIAVVISIQAPHACNIMNGLKTIEVRKSILNVLKELTENESKRLF